jgi:hypothetical protein
LKLIGRLLIDGHVGAKKDDLTLSVSETFINELTFLLANTLSLDSHVQFYSNLIQELISSECCNLKTVGFLHIISHKIITDKARIGGRLKAENSEIVHFRGEMATFFQTNIATHSVSQKAISELEFFSLKLNFNIRLFSSLAKLSGNFYLIIFNLLNYILGSFQEPLG